MGPLLSPGGPTPEHQALNRAVNHGKLNQNSLSGKMKKLNEDNVRERVLSEDEFEILLENLQSPLKEITLVAYHLAMRQKEILHLKWERKALRVIPRGKHRLTVYRAHQIL